MTDPQLPSAGPGAAYGSLPVPLRIYRTVLDVLTAVAKAIVGLLLLLLLALVASQFVDRYVHPLWGRVAPDEYVKVGLIWLTFLGFGIAVRAGVEIRVDLIDNLTAMKVRRWLYGAIDLALCLVLAVVLWKGVRLYEISTGQLILGTDLTVAFPTLGMLLGLALTMLSIVERLILRFYRHADA
jgi:TRAP-type transport system small permease protein